MYFKKLPEIDQLNSLFVYDKQSGNIVRKKSGKNAGYDGQHGRRVQINGTSYAVHRIIWKMCYEKEPSCMIDHIDGNPFNNKLTNLREATHSQNLWNSDVVLSKSGIRGVCIKKNRTKKYQARIRKYGKSYHLGTFCCPALAAMVYRLAKAQFHGQYNPYNSCDDCYKQMTAKVPIPIFNLYQRLYGIFDKN